MDKKSNIISGFKVGVLYSLIFPATQERFWVLHNGDIEESFQNPEWLLEREVVSMGVPSFPPDIDTQPMHHKTLDYNQRLLSIEQLHQLGA